MKPSGRGSERAVSPRRSARDPSDAHGTTQRTPDIARRLDAAAKLAPEVADSRDSWSAETVRAIMEGAAIAGRHRPHRHGGSGGCWGGAEGPGDG